MSETKEKIILNLRGTRFIVPSDCFKVFPNSRLARLNKTTNYDLRSGEYIFNRNPVVFNYILDLFVEGSCHLPTNECMRLMTNELDFWHISINLLDHCCWEKYQCFREDEVLYQDIRHNWLSIMDKQGYGRTVKVKNKTSTSRKSIEIEHEVETLDYGENDTFLYNFLEKPASSIAARIWSIFILCNIAIAIIVVCLDPLPSFRGEPKSNVSTGHLNDKVLFKTFYKTEPHPILRTLDLVATTILITEWILRFYASLDRKAFLYLPLNMIELISFMPVWIILVSENVPPSPINLNLLHAILVIRVLRVCLLFRASWIINFSSLTVMYLCMKASIRELVLLMSLIFIAVLFFSHLVFLADIQENVFPSVPHAFWWSIITLTTVGYGDKVPKSVTGQLIGALCAISGLIIIALPVPIIAGNFTRYYYYVHRIEREIIRYEMMDQNLRY